MTSHRSTGLTRASSEALGTQLRRLREVAGVPGRKAAAAAEMDGAKLSKIENGRLLPTTAQLAALAEYFKVPLAPLEARRLAEELLKAYAGNPAFAQATAILREEESEYRVKKVSMGVSKSSKPVNKGKKAK